MVRAFGFCNDSIEVTAPPRLCRGRERWLEGLPDVPPATVFRTVCSGAVFSDDSARDALRGLAHSGVSAGALIDALFPGMSLLGFAENGDPRALPPTLTLEEDWTHALAGGQRSVPAVRWLAPIPLEELDDYIAGERDGLAFPQVEGVIVGPMGPVEDLAAGVFQLVGFSEPDDRPARKYAASALPGLLDRCQAVLLFHLDKHGPVLAIYTLEPLESDEALVAVARAAGAFPVPFAIPPMLARWDRALYEQRMEWDPTRDGEFPVPPADDAGGRWSSRRRQFEEESAGRGGARDEGDRDEGDRDEE